MPHPFIRRPRYAGLPFAGLLLVVLLALLGSTALAQAPEARWTYRFGGAENENVFDVAVDRDGGAYLVGTTQGELERPTEGFFDVYLHAVDADGEPRWTRQLDLGDFEFLYAVTVAPDGDVIVGGFADGEIDGPAAGSDDALVMRFSPDGEERWRTTFATPERDQVFDVAVDDAGTIYAAGHSEGGLAGDPAGGQDAFLIALAADGTERWRTALATEADDQAYALAALDAGVLVATHSQGALDAPNEGGFDVYLRAYASDGTVTRRASLHDPADLRVYEVAIAPDGHWLAIGGGPEGPDDGADVPIFLRSIDPDGSEAAGAVAWSAELGPARRDLGHGVAVAPDGTIVAVASTEADVLQSNAGVADALVYGLGPAGEPIWSFQLGSERFDAATAVAAGPDGIWITGSTQGPLPDGVQDDGFDGDVWLRSYPF